MYEVLREGGDFTFFFYFCLTFKIQYSIVNLIKN